METLNIINNKYNKCLITHTRILNSILRAIRKCGERKKIFMSPFEILFCWEDENKFKILNSTCITLGYVVKYSKCIISFNGSIP